MSAVKNVRQIFTGLTIVIVVGKFNVKFFFVLHFYKATTPILGGKMCTTTMNVNLVAFLYKSGWYHINSFTSMRLTTAGFTACRVA